MHSNSARLCFFGLEKLYELLILAGLFSSSAPSALAAVRDRTNRALSGTLSDGRIS